MRFLIDNHLPPTLARWLISRGHEATHVFESGLLPATDRRIWSYAIEAGSVVISKDEDFIILARRSGDPGKLIWVRVGNCRINALLARFESVWPTIEKAFAGGQRVVELQ